MKNFFKLGFVALFVCFLSFLTSCGEYGGTIIVQNNYSTDKKITVYSEFSIRSQSSFGTLFAYKEKYGPKTIAAGSSGTFSLKEDTKCGVIWYDGNVDRYKTVGVSKGNTVEVNIP